MLVFLDNFCNLAVLNKIILCEAFVGLKLQSMRGLKLVFFFHSMKDQFQLAVPYSSIAAFKPKIKNYKKPSIVKEFKVQRFVIY